VHSQSVSERGRTEVGVHSQSVSKRGAPGVGGHSQSVSERGAPGWVCTARVTVRGAHRGGCAQPECE